MLSKFLKANILSKAGIGSVSLRFHSVWTPERVVKSPYRDVKVPSVTVDEYIWSNLDKWPTKTAAICGITNRGYTYEKIYQKSRILVANLRKKFKIRDGDTVAVILPNCPEFPLIVFGILAAGGIVSTLNPIYTAYELKSQLELSDARIVIAYKDIVPVVKESFKLSRMDLPIISVSFNNDVIEGTASIEELINDDNVDLCILKEVRRSASDVCFLPFSSGTTGLPKGVELTNTNMIANCEQQNTEFRQYEYTTASNQDSMLVALPMFHAYGLGILMMHKMSVGLRLVTLPKFHPETFLNAIKQYRINLLYVVPPMILFLGSDSSVTTKHLASLTCVMSGAAPLLEPDYQKFMNKTPAKTSFWNGYGMTEASPVVSMHCYGKQYFEDVGCALPNVKLRIVDGDMKNLGPGDVGELLVKGPNIMKGYKKNPIANSEVFVNGRWYRSGDLGMINEAGQLTIVGRLKELIKVKGYQVAPAELENILKEHPSVFNAAVVGVSDPNCGEKPRAFIQVKDDAQTSAEDIINFVTARVAPYKRITDVTFVENIPKSPLGKILRRVLKEEYC